MNKKSKHSEDFELIALFYTALIFFFCFFVAIGLITTLQYVIKHVRIV